MPLLAKPNKKDQRAFHQEWAACLAAKVEAMCSSKAALNSVVKSLSNDLTDNGFTVLAHLDGADGNGWT